MVPKRTLRIIAFLTKKEKMSLIPQDFSSYSIAKELKIEKQWKLLQNISLPQAIEVFLKSLKTSTANVYSFAFKKFFELQFLDPNMPLKKFALINLESKLDQIRETMTGKEATKQVKAAAFVSLTGFLQRQTEGLIKKVVPNKEKGRKTFQKIRDKTAGDVLSSQEVERFLQALKKASLRNYLIGAIQLQGAKRISEVLEAQIKDIDWENYSITFVQKKSNVLEKITKAFFPEQLMKELKDYLGERTQGVIFITRSGKELSRFDVRSFYRAAYKKSGITKKGATHVLRATAITELSRKGFRAEEIMTLSGHANLQMISYYDKSSEERNPSKRLSLL